MPVDPSESTAAGPLREILGYLNYSSGAPDPKFQAHWNGLFALELQANPEHAWQLVGQALHAQLDQLAGSDPAFADASQARSTLEIVFQALLPAYLQHHRDLLFHQTAAALFGPFFVARACEAVLQVGPQGTSADQVVSESLEQLNDFLGHRPVPTLRTPLSAQPYPHERVRPVPLYIRGAGVALGPYHGLVERALAQLASLPAVLRETAHFDLDTLEELAFDPRAYDFDHPVSKRPNYLFGQWDPHHLTGDGHYDRFVVQQITLDVLLERVVQPGEVSSDERLHEAAAVLAATMLMAAMTSGRAPEAHDSTVSLATLVVEIARLRDAVYPALLERTPEPLRERLEAEALRRKQPFAGARQHLNQRLARMRASQLQHVRLAELYARLGHSALAFTHVRAVPTASARMVTELRCHLTQAERLTGSDRLDDALAEVIQAEDVLLRAIDCGALVDPWNILGFQGQFSLFRAVENSVNDHRVEALIEQVELLFGGLRRLAAQAAAVGREDLVTEVQLRFERRTAWWDKYASGTVDQVRSLSGREAWESSRHVAQSLAAWHRGGTAAGDLAFWRKHVARFDSARAYAQVIEALLSHNDLVASQALLVQWAGQGQHVKLEDGTDSFHRLMGQWLGRATRLPWVHTRRFLELLEANAESWWEVPRFELGSEGDDHDAANRGESSREDDPDERFQAAYEEVTFRDSTADGIDAEMLEGGSAPSDFELELELEQHRLSARLAFLGSVAEAWQLAAVRTMEPLSEGEAEPDSREDILAQWTQSARRQREGLERLLDAVHRFAIPSPRATHEAHLEYDRRCRTRDSLLERVVHALATAGNALRILQAAQLPVSEKPGPPPEADEPFELHAIAALRAVGRTDPEAAREAMPALLKALSQQRTLFVPLGKGGDPRQLVAAKSLQHLLRQLLHGLPRLGLLTETCQLLRTAQVAERNRPKGSRPISEFDVLFRQGITALSEAVVRSSDDWGYPDDADRDAELLDVLRQWSRSLMRLWLRHSQSLRLSVLERLRDERHWQSVQQFIHDYGAELFTQRFLNVGNLRAILDFGVEAYLKRLQEDPSEGAPEHLLEDLESRIKPADAAAHLGLIVEAVVENVDEYLDYNTTTVQSDRGEMLFILLDFLKLKSGYQRVAWNIRPLVWIHDVLVRLGRTQAADQWRHSVVEQTSQVADWYLKRLAELRTQHAVDLSSVGDRLGERFVQPLALARLRALVGPAARELSVGQPALACETLEQEVQEFLIVPSGVGMGEPEWLDALSEEIEERTLSTTDPSDEPSEDFARNRVLLGPEDIETQWQAWDRDTP